VVRVDAPVDRRAAALATAARAAEQHISLLGEQVGILTEDGWDVPTDEFRETRVTSFRLLVDKVA
jgi:hypothetical protein